MGLKKRAKANAAFSMSSLTDIIFLLLIFFMLTSSLVAPNALNLKLPGSSNARTTVTSRNTDEVRITVDGGFYLNGRRLELKIVEQELARRSAPAPKDFNFIIAPAKNTPVEHVVAIMDVALRLGINGILAAEE